MPREIIRLVTILTLITFAPQIIVTIFKWIFRSEITHLRHHNYRLEEIVQDYSSIETVQQITDRLKNLPELNKNRQERWDLSRIQVKTRILLRKIQIKIKEKEKQLEQYSQSKQEPSSKI